MKSDSASLLQKASFVLLLMIFSCLVYLIARDRFRSTDRNEPAQAEPPASTLPEQVPSKPLVQASTFAPLRPRVETNSRTAPPDALSRKASGSDVNAALVTGGPQASTTRVRTGSSGASDFGGFVGGNSSAEASVTGVVTLRGTPPPEKLITLDPACGRLQPNGIATRHYVVGRDSGLANVFVYVKSGAPPTSDAQSGVPALDNIGCEFQPYVLGARVGQPFAIRNSDPLLHNVHALSRFNREFNLGLPVKGATVQRVFEKAEVFVRVKCDVHPWMFAYIGVVDHPWFAVTDGDGRFSLPEGLPAGRYTLAATHVKAGELTQGIRVAGSRVEPVQFVFDVPETGTTTAAVSQ